MLTAPAWRDRPTDAQFEAHDERRARSSGASWGAVRPSGRRENVTSHLDITASQDFRIYRWIIWSVANPASLWRRFPTDAVSTIGMSGDGRLPWYLYDLLRFATRDSLPIVVDAFEKLSGAELTGGSVVTMCYPCPWTDLSLMSPAAQSGCCDEWTLSRIVIGPDATFPRPQLLPPVGRGQRYGA